MTFPLSQYLQTSMSVLSPDLTYPACVCACQRTLPLGSDMVIRVSIRSSRTHAHTTHLLGPITTTVEGTPFEWLKILVAQTT